MNTLCIAFISLLLLITACEWQPISRSQTTILVGALRNLPTVSVTKYGAKCDGVTDDTTAIQNAFNIVPGGYILSFPSGTCLYSDTLTLNTQNVILEGRGGILKATDPANQAIVMAGNNTTIRGMTIKGAGTTRLTTNESTQIWVTGQYVQVVSNDISGGASAGIIVVGATHYRVIDNVVHENLADGIHSTEGSQFGLVQGNTLYENGDDSIAVVSYGDNSTISGHIRIHNNRVKGNTHGRGIACLGCDTVTITNNTIYDVVNNAGILIAQDTAWDTWGVNGVLIKNNNISNIEVAPGGGATQQAGIDIITGDERPVQYVSIENNTINNTAYEGIRILDYSESSGFNNNINVKENTVSAVSGDPIAFISAPGTPKVTTCYNNTYNGMIYPVSRCTVQKLTSESWTQFNFIAPEGQWVPAENTCSVRSTSNKEA